MSDQDRLAERFGEPPMRLTQSAPPDFGSGACAQNTAARAFADPRRTGARELRKNCGARAWTDALLRQCRPPSPRLRRAPCGAPLSVLPRPLYAGASVGAPRADATMAEGAVGVAGGASMCVTPAARLHPVVVNGGAGVVATLDGRPISLTAFTVVGG